MKARELSALMVDSHTNIYEAAASLFDSNTHLDIDDEYQRGVIETVMRVVGIDSDYKDEVAEVISEFTVHVDHKEIAREWIRRHGLEIYPEMEDEIRGDYPKVSMSSSDLSLIRGLIETATMEIQFN